MKKFSVFILVVLIVAACSQKRSERFSQGQGRDLFAVADYHNKTFTLKTHKKIGSSPTNNASATDINAPKYDFYAYPLVAYDTDAKLLGDVAFRGLENTEYKIVYHVDNKYLKIFKVALKQLIPSDEYPYAEQIEGLGEGEIAIPLVGYPIRGFVKVEHQKNVYDEESHLLVEVPLNGFDTNSFAKIDFNSRQVFESVVASDIFPKKFFDGEWFYSQTITKTRDKSKGDENEGMDSYLYDASQVSASRIRFLMDSDRYVRGVDVNVAQKLKKDEMNYKPLFSIPAEWLDLEGENIGNTKGMKGIDKKRKYWNEKDLVSLKLNEFFDLGSREDALGAVKQVTDLSVQDDYIGISLLYPEIGYRVVHSFVRAGGRAPYQARRYPKSDHRLFGFFDTLFKPENGQEIYYEDDLYRRTFINRFNPEKPEIVYYMRLGSDDEATQLAGETIAHWNATFQEATKGKMSVRLDTSKQVALGDIRYNIVNFMSAEGDDSLAPLAFGPSVFDPDSGEIISATTNIYISQLRFEMMHLIRDYLAKNAMGIDAKTGAQVGALERALIRQNELAGPTLNPRFAADIQKVKAFAPKVKTNLEFFKEIYELKTADEEDAKKKSRRLTKRHDNCSANISVDFSQEQIQKLCPAVVKLAEEYKKTKVTGKEEELAIVENCADVLIPDMVRFALTHEMGHNFGLRHNFRGSADKANFYPIEVTKTEKPVESSSVMDYPAFTTAALKMPGSYDVAAIRYAYSNQVELKDSSLLTLDKNKSIEEQAANLKKYQYCTDEDTELGNDTLCDRFDRGTTNVELVKWLISMYYDSIYMDSYRSGRTMGVSFNERVYSMARSQGMGMKIAMSYMEYRDQIRKELMRDNPYFQGISTANYQKDYLDKVDALIKRKKAAGDTLLEDLRDAAKLAEEFNMTIAFLPDHYCILADTDTGLATLETFSTLRDNIWFESGKAIKSCKDSDAQAYFTAKKLALRSEFGQSLESYRYSMRDEDRAEPHDVIGTVIDREMAFANLFAPFGGSQKLHDAKFTPSMADDPVFRQRALSAYINRVTRGLNFKGLPAGSKTKKEDVVYRFSNEVELYTKSLKVVSESFFVPNSPLESMSRLAPYMMTVTNNPDIVQEVRQSQENAWAELPGTGVVYASMEQNPIASQIILAHRNHVVSRSLNPEKLEKMQKALFSSFEKEGGGTLKQLLQKAGEALEVSQLLGSHIADEKLGEAFMEKVNNLQGGMMAFEKSMKKSFDEKDKNGASEKELGDAQKKLMAVSVNEIKADTNDGIEKSVLALKQNEEELAALSPQFQETLEQVKADIEDNQKNKTEVSAQLQLMTSLIQMFSGVTGELTH